MAKKTFLNKYNPWNMVETDETVDSIEPTETVEAIETVEPIEADEPIESVELQVRNSAFDRRLRTFAIVNKVPRLDIEDFLKDAFHLYEREIVNAVGEYNMIKSMTVFVAEYEKELIKTFLNENENEPDNSENESDMQTIKETLYFTTPNVLIGADSDIEEHFKLNINNEIQKSVEETAFRGSGFRLARIIELNVQISSYEPLDGSSYIATPGDLNKKKAIVNVKNMRDNECFKWAILSALYPAKQNPHRLNYLKHENKLNFDGINFPVNLKDIDKFVKQNDWLSVNVYYYDVKTKKVCPLRVSDVVREKHVHLLLITKSMCVDTNAVNTTTDKIKIMIENDQVKSHYCWIKNLSRLVSSQLTKRDHKKHICDRCLNYFDNE